MMDAFHDVCVVCSDARIRDLQSFLDKAYEHDEYMTRALDAKNDELVRCRVELARYQQLFLEACQANLPK
jgi:DNA-directed RNA polymerase specialized sigma54-like protein